MSYAPFAAGKIASPNCYSGRSTRICKFTPHHMAAAVSAATCGTWFQNPDRQASSNYGIGMDGELICYVEDEDTAWTSSSYWNDTRAITVEVANTPEGVWNDTWEVSDAAWETLVRLGVYVCSKYGFRLEYTGDEYGTLTEHNMFAATGCPGPYLHARMNLLAETVNAILDGGGDMSTASDVWEYNWENTAPMGNMYNCNIAQYKGIADLLDKVNALTTKVNALSAKVDKITAGGVDTAAVAAAVVAKMDYSKMAKSVNDDAAKRMQA